MIWWFGLVMLLAVGNLVLMIYLSEYDIKTHNPFRKNK